MQSFYETRRQGNEKEFLLSFSKISSRELKQAVESLHDAWTEKEGA
jgi:GntR family transcriptional regulator/MocR family aminotransferase